MFDKKAFANSIAGATGFAYVVFAILFWLAPPVFAFLFNAQFLGADIASLMPEAFSFGNFVGVFLAVVIFAWILGYLWAWLYNRFAKK